MAGFPGNLYSDVEGVVCVLRGWVRQQVNKELNINLTGCAKCCRNIGYLRVTGERKCQLP